MGHSRSWGYGPSGALGLVALILIVLPMTGRIERDREPRAATARLVHQKDGV
jgi:Protein of unknown function (DUF3309)